MRDLPASSNSAASIDQFDLRKTVPGNRGGFLFFRLSEILFRWSVDFWDNDYLE